MLKIGFGAADLVSNNCLNGGLKIYIITYGYKIL